MLSISGSIFLLDNKISVNSGKIHIFTTRMQNRTLKPFHSVILKLDKPLTETVKCGNLDLYLDPSWHPEQHVTVTGTVVSLPKNHPYGKDLPPGSQVAFSYQVVAERQFDDEPENYHPRINEENLKIFYNALGEKIQIRAVQGLISKKFVCVHWNKKGEFDFGMDGTKNEADRWLSQFKFGSSQQYKFTNCIELDGQMYWKADFDQIFAKKVGKKLISIGNRLILNPIKMNLTPEDFEKNGLQRPISTVSLTAEDVAKVESAPIETGIKKGATIGFDSRHVEKYEFFGRSYFILNKERIQGVWSNN